MVLEKWGRIANRQFCMIDCGVPDHILATRFQPDVRSRLHILSRHPRPRLSFTSGIGLSLRK